MLQKLTGTGSHKQAIDRVIHNTRRRALCIDRSSFLFFLPSISRLRVNRPHRLAAIGLQASCTGPITEGMDAARLQQKQ